MRLNKYQRQRQWDRALAYLYCIENRESMDRPLQDIFPEILEKIKSKQISQTPKCMGTQCRGVSTVLLLHHKDGNEKNDSLSNLAILCKSCNARKQNWGEFGGSKGAEHSTYVCVCENELDSGVRYEVDDNRVVVRSAEMHRSIISEKLFLNYLSTLFTNGEIYTEKDVINSCAKVAGCSPYTVQQRYLPKETNAINGTFEVFKDENGIKMIRRRK